MLTVTPFQIASSSGHLLINCTLFLVSIRLIQTYDSKLFGPFLWQENKLCPWDTKLWRMSFSSSWETTTHHHFFSLKSVYGEMFLSTHLLAIQVWTCEVFNYDSYQEWDFLNIPKPLKLVSFSPSPSPPFLLRLRNV